MPGGEPGAPADSHLVSPGAEKGEIVSLDKPPRYVEDLELRRRARREAEGDEGPTLRRRVGTQVNDSQLASRAALLSRGTG